MTKIVLDFPEFQDVRWALGQCLGWIEAGADQHRNNPYYPGVIAETERALNVLLAAYDAALDAQEVAVETPVADDPYWILCADGTAVHDFKGGTCCPSCGFNGRSDKAFMAVRRPC